MIHAVVEEALWGAVDLHCHPGPNPLPREFDHVEAARDAARLGMRGILAKSHHHNTVMDLLALNRELADIDTPVFGGIALNAWVGGINPHAVAMSLRMGGRAVWFPTLSSRQHVEHGPQPKSAVELTNQVVEVRGADGALTESTREVIGLIAEGDALLSSGHVGSIDAIDLFREGTAAGVRRMVLSHPNHVVGASADDCRAMCEAGAFIEHTVGAYDPEGTIRWDVKTLYEWIRDVGVEYTVLASDLGQRGRPMPVDGFLRVGSLLVDLGLTPDELRRMACDNPAFLLGLDDERP